MGKLIDLTGQKFNRLTVIERAYVKKGVVYWHCICECGKEKFVNGRKLRDNITKSCGCYKSQEFKKRVSTHKLSKTKLYRTYRSIINRCYDRNNPNYHNYGGRGIVMCEDWKNDFKTFYDWAYANGYKEELLQNGKNKWTIDRIDVNGNYEPSNCRWATWEQQANNKRQTVYLTYKGKTLTQRQWAKKLGLDDCDIYWRLKNGWSISEVLSVPKKYGNRINNIRNKKENN